MKKIRVYSISLLLSLLTLAGIQLKGLISNASDLEKSTYAEADKVICEAFRESVSEESKDDNSTKCQNLGNGQFEMMTTKRIDHLGKLIDNKIAGIGPISVPYELKIEPLLLLPFARTEQGEISTSETGVYKKAEVNLHLPAKSQFLMGQVNGDVIFSFALMGTILVLCFKIFTSFQNSEHAVRYGRKAAIFQIGNYIFDSKNQLLILNEQVRRITRKESQILGFLSNNKNKLVRRDDILIELWGENDYFKGRSLDVFMAKLRGYLSEDQSLVIETVYGVGFVLKDNKTKNSWVG